MDSRKKNKGNIKINIIKIIKKVIIKMDKLWNRKNSVGGGKNRREGE